jgi:hypothetical protein
MSSPLLVDIVAYWNLNNDGSGGVSVLDSTGNANNLVNNGVYLGQGIIDNGGEWNTPFQEGNAQWLENNSVAITGNASASVWVKPSSFNDQSFYIPFCLGGGSANRVAFFIRPDGEFAWLFGGSAAAFEATVSFGQWNHVAIVADSDNGVLKYYLNGVALAPVSVGSGFDFSNVYLGCANDQAYSGGSLILEGNLDEVGVWSRALSAQDVSDLYNNGSGNTYPFDFVLYYNNAENDGDWGNLLNWWQDSSFTSQATALPTATNPVNLYNQVTQNTEGANQCFCASANFWSANFGVGLTLQASGVVNMQGTSLLAGTTTDGVSMHDSSQLTATSIVQGSVTMRDSSRAFGSILGNATIYYDGGDGQYPIGGTVGGTVTYVGWPAVTPQWFNDQASGGGNNGDFSDLDNWWSDDTYTTRPLNTTGTQELPDASTDIFIAPNTGITANSRTANPTVNSVTANNSNIQNISITATNGFVFSGNEGAQNATLYGSVTFQDTAYNDHSVIQGTATYKSAASLQNSWNQNSLGNLNSGASVGSTGFVVNISGGGGGGTALGTNWISRLLHLPWFINV